MIVRTKTTSVLIVFFLLTASPTTFSATTIAGKSCSKAGQTKISGKLKFTCIKSGKKLIWNKGVAITPVAVPNSPSQPVPIPIPIPIIVPAQVPVPVPVPIPVTPINQPVIPIVNPGIVQPTPASSPIQNNPQQSSSSSPVKEITSSYTELVASSGTKITSSSSPSSYLAAMGYASTTGTSLFDHPSGLASDGTNLILVDRGNNRILVWKVAPTSPTTGPDFVLCQQNTTATGSGSGLSQCNWPSDAVVTTTGKLLVADSDNNRILVWNSMPTTTGASASFAIDLGKDAWPWGIWSDGTKVAATLTGKGKISIWNSFPTTGSESPSFSIEGGTSTCLGTPRGLLSNGTTLMTGDHNGKCGEEKGLHVYVTFPTSATAKPNYMIVPNDANYAWPMGSFDKSTGKAYLLSRYLDEYASFPSTKPAGTTIATKTEFEGGDGGDVEIINGYMYVTEYNGNRISVFKGIPTANSIPDFYLGLSSTNITSPVENPLKENFLITNPQVATLDGAMAINSDFDRSIYVWKKIPATSGAKPDLVWTTQNQHDSNALLAMDFQPDSSDTGKLGGKSIYAVAGEKTFVVWEGIPTSKTAVPILNIKDAIGNITFNMHLRVAVDDKYFYLLDGGASKIYIWEGLPADKNDNPDFTLTAEVNRIRADGKYLVGASLYNSPHILVWNIATLKSGANPSGKVNYQMNLPQDALTAGEALYVADTSFHRTLYWASITSAMNGSSPDAIVGAGSDSSDTRPAQSESEMRWPASLWVENGYLWVGERKFGHRIFRYNLS